MEALDPITRSDLQRLAELRIQEAELLLNTGHPEGAYYLAGYAVECALKACICARGQPDHFPPRPDVVNAMYSHNLVRLRELAKLDATFNAEADAALKASWGTVKDWKEQSRYNFPTQTEAEQLFGAVADPTHGVLPWLRRRW